MPLLERDTPVGLSRAVSPREGSGVRDHAVSVSKRNNMRPSRLCRPLSFLASLFMLFSPVLTFNVDLVTSTVHRGPDESMFGFAIAQYRQGGQSWLIIGAPKAQTNQPSVRRGGAVYRCIPDLRNRCQQIPFDQDGSNEITVRGKTEKTEEKSEQWFGATVQTSGEDGVIVACAPRYVFFGQQWNKREPVGICWLTSRDFTSTKKYCPCKDYLGYYKQGYCQAGFSAAVAKNGENLYMGAVGSWHWQGQVFSQNLTDESILYKTNKSPREYDDTYLGYSTAVGEFTGDNDMDVVVGMPKDNITGKIVLYNSKLKNLLNITGEQIGSYFGYSVCVADINGDKLDDIIIGAPLFSDFRTKRGKYEEGRVYIIFQNNKHKFDGMVHLDGIHTKGRFGLALTSLGDINKDDYQDFAVGAPYGGEHGKGAVYIYHGSSDSIKKASQIIEPHDFGHSSISSFGFSLSGGMDLDNNHYPDLMVGAYESDSVIHFRSRPIVNVTAKLKVSVESISLKEESKCSLINKTKVFCFDVIACLEYTGHGIEHELAFLYQLKLDSTKDDPRVFFLSEGNTTERNESVSFNKDFHYCTPNNYIYVQSKIRDKLTPITISLKYFLIDPHPFSRTLKSIVSQDVPNEILEQVNIQKNCGEDNQCFPDLQLDTIPNMDTFVIEDDRDLELNFFVSNAGEDAFEAMLYLVMPLDVNLKKADTSKTNFSVLCGGPHLETGVNVLVCDIGNPLEAGVALQFRVLLQPSNIVSAINELVFNINVNSSNFEFANRTFDNYQEIHLPVKVKAEIEIHGITDPEIISYKKSDPVPATKMTESDIGPEVIHNYTLINKGPSTIKLAEIYILWPSYNLENEPLLYLMEQVLIKGQNARCKEVVKDVNPFHVQKEIKSFKQSSSNRTDISDKNIDEDHPLAEIFERRRRDAYGWLLLLEDELKCGKSVCTKIACSVSNLKKHETVTFTLKSRLWRESVNKLGLKEVQISSKLVVAVKELPYDVSRISLPIKSAKVSTKVVVTSTELPWWIIILAVCGGLLLLGLLALLLWKLGFFERKRPQEKPEKVPFQKNGYQLARGDEAL